MSELPRGRTADGDDARPDSDEPKPKRTRRKTTADAADAPKPKARRTRKKKEAPAEDAAPAPEAETDKPKRKAPAKKTAAPEAAADDGAEDKPKRRRTRKKTDEPVASSDQPAEEAPADEAPKKSSRRRSRKSSDDQGDASESPQASSDDGSGDDRSSDDRSRDEREPSNNQRDGGRNEGGRGRRKRNKRGRNNEQGNNQQRQQKQEPKGTPFEGMLEMIGDKKFGFIRSLNTSLQKGDNDPFMPPPLIEKFNIRDGAVLTGELRPGRKGAMQVSRVDTVMGEDPEVWKEREEFDSGVVIYPDERLDIVAGPSDVTMRVTDLAAPIGKGQRALIVAPPRSGKTIILKKLAAGISKNHPNIELVALLVDERPEEVTDFVRNTKARVFASSNDFAEDNHVRVATLAFEYARRVVEQGKDVVMLLDSLTRLGRAFNMFKGGSGRTMSGGLDQGALIVPRRIFGSARNIEGGGSLTIIATALIETGSRMDDVIFEEFKGTGNAEIVLDRELSEKRIFPAINLRKSGTRNEERLIGEDQIRQHHLLFRALNSRHPVEAMQALLRHVLTTESNDALLQGLIPSEV
jgi:transcription termination factor Rho